MYPLALLFVTNAPTPNIKMTLNNSMVFVVVVLYETGSHCVALAVLELTVYRPVWP